MYNVIAIGNALVDHEYTLDDSQLAHTGLNKGSMTLASLEEQSALLDSFKTLNISPSKQSGGGSAANAMFAFACLGGKAFYGCRVGDDKEGDFYLKDLKQAGVETSQQSIAEDGVTGSCVVAITPDGERTMQTYLGTSSEISADNIDLDALKNSDWLYLEGYLAMSESLQPAVDKLRQHALDNNIQIAVSFADPSVINFAKDGLMKLLGDGVEVIFCNAEEAILFTGKSEIKDAAQALAEYARLVVVTNSAKDTILCQHADDGSITFTSIGTPSVARVVDTNGAGDNYSGAFLYALTQNLPLTQCGELAGAVASQIVQQFGPRLNAEQYQNIVASVVKANSYKG